MAAYSCVFATGHRFRCNPPPASGSMNSALLNRMARRVPKTAVFSALLKGGFRTLSGLLGKTRRDQYKVDGAVVATIGIRGTEYAAQLNDGGLTVSTFEGLVEVCSAAACAQVGPGQTVVVADGSSVPRPRNPAPGGAGGLAGAGFAAAEKCRVAPVDGAGTNAGGQCAAGGEPDVFTANRTLPLSFRC